LFQFNLNLNNLLFLKEAPPERPRSIEPRVIKISGKLLPPPPRKVVIERLPQMPNKPQPIIIERWLPYQTENVKRRVVFQKQPDPVQAKPRNVNDSFFGIFQNKISILLINKILFKGNCRMANPRSKC